MNKQLGADNTFQHVSCLMVDNAVPEHYVVSAELRT